MSRALNKMIGWFGQVQIADKWCSYFSTSYQLSDNHLSSDVSKLTTYLHRFCTSTVLYNDLVSMRLIDGQ